MSYLLAALLSSLSFAILDNLNGVISKKTTPLQFSFWANVVGSIIFLPFALLQTNFEDVANNQLSLLWAAILGLAINLGFWCFISAMKRGSITVAGVIGGSYPVVATIIALIVFNEQLRPAELAIIAVIIFATTLAALNTKFTVFVRDIRSNAALFAFGALLLWGTYYGLIVTVVDDLGWFLPVYITYLVGTVLFGSIASLKDKRALKLPPKKISITIAVILAVAGSSFYTYGVSNGPTAIVAPIAGSTPAFFVIIAYFLFKEKLRRIQWTGIVLTVLGIIALSVLRSN